MKLEIIKYIDVNTNKILVKASESNQQEKTFKLFINNLFVSSVNTKNSNLLFNVNEVGTYTVEMSFADDKEEHHSIRSNEVIFHDLAAVNPLRYEKANENKKIKTIDIKHDDIEVYYLEIKIKKGNYENLKRLRIINNPLTFTPLNISLENIDIDDNAHQFEYIKYDGESNFEKLRELAEKIEDLDFVEYCSVTPNTSNYLPPKELHNVNYDTEHDTFSTTPSFHALQTYLNEPRGMNIIKAWNKDINGSTVVIRHLDFGIYRNHENFKNSNITVVHSRPETEDCNHGTASTGCIVAAKESFGVTGIAHACKYYFYDTGDLDLIVRDSQPGDIVSLDIQFSSNNKLLPVTSSKSWWDKIDILIKKGATVILAAGNGGLNLSLPSVMTNYGDNGSMLVGACTHNSGRRVGFSNYGHETSLINSWGDWSVATTGYGGLQSDGVNRSYTGTYSGTSSATPLCSGAIALLQDYSRKKYNSILSPWKMREIISQSDYNEGVSDGIGHRPNINYLLQKIDIINSHSIANKYPNNFINNAYCILLNLYTDKNSEDNFEFNYDESNIDSVGFICAYKEQGPSELGWSDYGKTNIYIPVVDSNNNINTLYLQVSKKDLCGTRTMNSTGRCGSSTPNKFELSFEYNQEDNKYLPKGSYKGTLPLYAKSWFTDKNYRLNVLVNIRIN
ncbi:S8 family serine peptidase [Pectobacterium versatile]|uniref:S8 family serine peptidase n=1 Tax=Pectobacterium versatile TaxID=2488639 RepID=UPI001CCC0D68|nr:S8 family serine peptidase [Pectobacterium versatile]